MAGIRRMSAMFYPRQFDGALGRKGARMTRKTAAAFVIGATLALGVASASAGPCTADIAQFENTVRHSAKNPDAGPMGPQTVDAQLGPRADAGFDKARRGASSNEVRDDAGACEDSRCARQRRRMRAGPQ